MMMKNKIHILFDTLLMNPMNPKTATDEYGY